jgi:HrpA-like RNA helicase
MQLPIFSFKSQLIDAFTNYSLLVVVGETGTFVLIKGSGKTTQLPQYLLEVPNIKKVAITQPRRIAAISNAKRVAEEMNTRLGRKVGYSVRFDDVSSDDTRLKFMTDGLLLRECCSDLLLKEYDAIVIDEAHERSLNTDLLLGLLKQTIKKRTDLKIIVMSATLNIEKMSDYLDSCPIFNIPGSRHVL